MILKINLRFKKSSKHSFLPLALPPFLPSSLYFTFSIEIKEKCMMHLQFRIISKIHLQISIWGRNSSWFLWTFLVDYQRSNLSLRKHNGGYFSTDHAENQVTSMGRRCSLYCGYFVLLFFLIRYNSFKNIFMQLKNKKGTTPTQFMKIIFGFVFELFEYFKYDDLNYVS